MFKSYTTNDNLLLPPTLGDFIEQKDPVRVINRIIESVDLKPLYEKYPGGGCPAYHPRMMLKLLVYAYMRNIYSSRRIEEFARNDIRFMWLIGMSCPDHNTINRFRNGYRKETLRNIFTQVVEFMFKENSSARIRSIRTELRSSRLPNVITSSGARACSISGIGNRRPPMGLSRPSAGIKPKTARVAP